MKIKFEERDHALEINMVPETVEEVAMLFRFVNNAKMEAPYVTMNFAKNAWSPYCNMFLKKKTGHQVKNSISRYALKGFGKKRKK